MLMNFYALYHNGYDIIGLQLNIDVIKSIQVEI